MRFNDALNHQIQAANGPRQVLRGCNTTASAVVVRIFNVPDAGRETIDINSVSQSNAIEYGNSIPANTTWEWEIDTRYPVIVYSATANAINWSLR